MLAPTLTLCALWLLLTVTLVALSAFLGWALPGFIAKAGPFILAGFVTGRFVSMSGRRPKIIAAAVLTLVSAAAWTSFSFATTDLSPRRALLLFAVSLPVNIMAGAWAYFGMFLGGRSRETPRDPELDELERELRNEMAKRKGD